jgi:erythronate-4-phosphate dehydrogenase
VKFIVDQNIRGAEATFGGHGTLAMMEGREIARQHLLGSDALIIRTATRANRALLEGTGIGFVGTTSIGTDHLDIPWLESAGIAWSNAPGCNADSAAQYTLAMIWLACDRLDRELIHQRVGIIGHGNVGSRLHRLLSALGVDTVANDPPLADQGVPGLVSREEVLSKDIVCLHVPLTNDGPYPTRGFIGTGELARMPDGALLVNTARGDVVVGDSLMREMASGRLHAALDCWPGEPHFSSELLDATTVATPHVAGYSSDGKLNGTTQVYRAFCKWAGAEPAPPASWPGKPPQLAIPDDEDGVTKALESACFVRRHDSLLRELSKLSVQDRAAGFDRLRRDYPERRDFHAWNIHCGQSRTAQILGNMGFSLSVPH